MIALTSSATRCHKPIVILTGPAYGAKCSTPVSVRFSSALSSMASRVRRCCTPRKLVGAIFGAKVSLSVMTVTIAAMWWHNFTVLDIVDAQRAVAIDCLCGFHWIVACLFGKGGAL